MQFIGLLLVGSLVALSMAHPHMPGYYGNRRPAYYNPYYNPYYSPMMGNRAPMDYYNPAMSPYSLPVANNRYFRPYYQPFMVLYLTPLNKPSKLDQNKEQQQPEYEMRQDGDAGQQDAPIPGAYIVPANVNGAFGGPLAVTSANQGSSAELGTEYFPLEGAQNKPALERILASLTHQQQPHTGPYYPAQQQSDYYAQQRYPYDK